MTLENMIYHGRAVARGTESAMVVVDLPFGSYQGNSKEALASAIRIMKETEADAVKLEGGSTVIESVERIVSAGIPVMGHLGLTPQAINVFGSYSVRAKDDAEAQTLIDDAIRLEKAGCFGMVLEKIPAQLAGRVTESISVPTIGIGAGAQVDGQVLVSYDMLGINHDFNPRFLRRYANLHVDIRDAIVNYCDDVRSGSFPNESEQY